MLDRTNFASWQQQIRLYCRGKENKVNILKSINEGPFQMGTFQETLVEGNEGALHLGPERPRVNSDLSPEDKDRYNADIWATNILLQGLPKDIYSLINHYTDAKDIWDNVKMLLEGSELTKEDRESQLYDDFEHFCQHKGETIYDYYVRFSKLINDMRNIKMTMSRMQLNSKFVNNMLPEWGRFVTAVKLNRGLRDSNYDQLYAYLKQHEAHANENKMMLDRFTQHTVDPLALMSNVAPQQYNSQSSTNPSSTYVPPHFADNSQLDSGLSPTDNLIENLTNTLALLTQSYKTYLPQTNNQLRTSSNPRNQATVQDGRVVVQNVQGRHNRGQGNNARGAGTAGYRGALNRVGNANPGQARQVKCYNCNGFSTHYKKNEIVLEESISVLKLEVRLRANDLDQYKMNLEKAENERDQLKQMLEKFQNSSKSLNDLLESQVIDKFKTGLGYNAATTATPAVEKSENLDVTTVVTPSNVKTVADRGISNTVESNAVRMDNTSAPIIDDWNSDDESEIDYTIEPSIVKIKFVKTVRETDAAKQNP
ncbi:hypothetical protein Tco_0139098 [Tanacetum coccineum]